jgi:riboflavin kinase/FMN adenylyltransferase
MKTVYGINQIKRYPRPVVAMGVFDGVHRGHRLILTQAVLKTKVIKGTSIVVTFSPHPQKEESIYSLEHRLRILSELGIDVCIVIPFTRAFANMSAQDFIRKILVGKIHCTHIYIGKNFRFGRGGAGDVRLLKKVSQTYSFSVRAFDVKKIRGKKISSTLIRRLIAAGRLRQAQMLLSRRVSVFGTVIRGQSLATQLGYPTANIDSHQEVIPPPGIYIVDAIVGKKELHGVCNIGFRPTFARRGETEGLPRVEVHIFDLKKYIYGKNIEVQFLKKIRAEKRFSSPRLLADQIKKDIKTAKAIFSRH